MPSPVLPLGRHKVFFHYSFAFRVVYKISYEDVLCSDKSSNKLFYTHELTSANPYVKDTKFTSNLTKKLLEHVL